MSILAYIWGKFQGWIIAAGAIITILATAYAKGRMDQKTVTTAKVNEKRLDDIQEAKKVDEEIKKLSPSDVDKRLSKYMRD